MAKHGEVGADDPNRTHMYPKFGPPNKIHDRIDRAPQELTRVARSGSRQGTRSSRGGLNRPEPAGAVRRPVSPFGPPSQPTPAYNRQGRRAQHSHPNTPWQKALQLAAHHRDWWAKAAVCSLSVLVLLASGISWFTMDSLISGFTTSNALGNGPRSLDGSMNVLLIGLDSRKDLEGNDLPKSILSKLHAGDSDRGGYNTNTLILLHLPAGGGTITGFSIPRDDYVQAQGITGYDHIKIKEAYGLKKAQVEAKLAEEGVTNPHTLETQGREAGRAETIATVRALTGVPIDRFAEINLAGFYDLATALGGVEVCLNHAVHDRYSGANFPAGRQKLNGSQALAFVRQRHGLANGDLDRTRRQQAFLASVASALKSQNVIGDPAALSRLVEVAHKDIVLSSGWDLTSFAQRLGTMTGALNIKTLPVMGFQTIDGQDVNIIDPEAIRAEVQAAFGVTPTSTTTSPGSSATANAAAVKPAAVTEEMGSNRPKTIDNTSGDTASTSAGAPHIMDGVPCVN